MFKNEIVVCFVCVYKSKFVYFCFALEFCVPKWIEALMMVL